MKEKLSINDIAKLANVSKSTVSRYLNQGYVKNETRVKIANVIKENNYEPNRFARLKAKSSHIIGVIAPCLDSSVTSQVLMSIDATLRENDYISLIINTNHDNEEELRNMENLSRMNVDGIIINATQVSEKHDEIAKRLEIPVVFVAQTCNEGVSIINEDYKAGMYVGEYAANCGHKSILCVSVDEQDEAIGVQRKQGIIDGLTSKGVDKIDFVLGDFSLQYSYERIKAVLDKDHYDMIICSTTKQLLAAYKCVREKALKIPDDISIIGFGGLETSEMLVPKATTVQFNPPMTGVISANAMLAMLSGEEVQQIQRVPFTFNEGESVKRRN